jgi:hypothetical protein
MKMEIIEKATERTISKFTFARDSTTITQIVPKDCKIWSFILETKSISSLLHKDEKIYPYNYKGGKTRVPTV